MLRRVNLYSICFVFGFGALLFASSVFTDNSNNPPSTEDQRNAWTYLQTGNGEDGWLQPISTDPDDGSPDIETILDKTRSEIKLELQNFNLTNLGVDKLEDLVLETDGNPVRSVIVSTWRSGSSFLGQVLDAVPGSFYRYEPLQHYGNLQIMRGTPHADDAIRTLRKMLKCDYSGSDDYFKFIKMRMFDESISSKTWDHCNKKELCYDTNFTSRFCKLFPFQTMKVLRMGLSLIEDILEDKQLNIKMIFLIRDPRGVMQSRQHLNFSPQATDFWKPELLCAHMISNHAAAGRLIQKYPDRFMVLRYEELVLALNKTTHKLLKFLRLQGATKSVDEYLHTHTNVEVPGVHSTFRVSQNVPFKWKNLLKYSYVEEIQEVCKEAMSVWGYKLANNATHMASKEFNPLEPYTITQ